MVNQSSISSYNEDGARAISPNRTGKSMTASCSMAHCQTGWLRGSWTSQPLRFPLAFMDWSNQSWSKKLTQRNARRPQTKSPSALGLLKSFGPKSWWSKGEWSYEWICSRVIFDRIQQHNYGIFNYLIRNSNSTLDIQTHWKVRRLGLEDMKMKQRRMKLWKYFGTDQIKQARSCGCKGSNS